MFNYKWTELWIRYPGLVILEMKTDCCGAIVRDTWEDVLSSKLCTWHVTVHVTFRQKNMTERVTESDDLVISVTSLAFEQIPQTPRDFSYSVQYTLTWCPKTTVRYPSHQWVADGPYVWGTRPQVLSILIKKSTLRVWTNPRNFHFVVNNGSLLATVSHQPFPWKSCPHFLTSDTSDRWLLTPSIKGQTPTALRTSNCTIRCCSTG